MGISANQARLMTLCSRQHDLELRAQNISAIKMVKAMESQEMATKYSDALDKYSKMKSGEEKAPTIFIGLASDGVHAGVRPAGTYSSEDGWTEADMMAKFGDSYQVIHTGEGEDGAYSKEQCEEFLKKAEAEYDIETKKLSSEEKKLDLELTQINTEHSAVTTEYDSVKSLISDNTDKSFNIFG